MNFREILLPVDLNDESSWSHALPAAINLARSSQARLHVLTVVPDFGMSIVGQFFPKDFEHTAIAEAEKRIAAFAADHIPADVAGRHLVAHGSVYKEIIDAAEAHSVDLIIMGAHRPDLEDYLLGPNAARVVRHSRCSVLVVRS